MRAASRANDDVFLWLAGYTLGILNTCLDWMAGDLDFDVTKGGSIVVSAALIGASIGSLAAGQFADRVGPGKALVVNNISLLAGSVLCAFSYGGIWAAVVGKHLWHCASGKNISVSHSVSILEVMKKVKAGVSKLHL